MYKCFACMYVCTPHTGCDHRGQKRAWLSWKMVFWATLWVLVIKSGSSRRTASACNHWVVSPTPSRVVFFRNLGGFWEFVIYVEAVSSFEYMICLCCYSLSFYSLLTVFPEQFYILKSFVAFLVRVVVIIFKSSSPTFSIYHFAHVLS